MSQNLFIYTQLNSFKYFYWTLILLFNITYSFSHSYMVSNIIIYYVHTVIWCSWKNFVFLFDRYGCRIFSPNEVDLSYSTRTIFPGQHNNGESLPNSLPQNLSSRMDGLSVFSLHSSRTITPWGKPSNLWTLESTLLDQRFWVGYKLDVFIPPLTGTLLCHL